MIINRLALFFITLCLEGYSASAWTQDLPERPLLRAAQEYFDKLTSGKYQELERDLQKLKAEGTIISDGQPALAAFYMGVSTCRASDCDRGPGQLRLYKALSEWKAAYPKSIIAQLANAMYFENAGWRIRGSAYADKVPPSAWPMFRNHIQTAREMLEAIGPGGKSEPGWYQTMLGIGQAQGWSHEEMFAIFSEGSKRFPLYFPIYFGMASYLSPKWYGSIKAQRQFIEAATETTQARLGETLYARINWATKRDEMFEDGQADWNRMRAGFERLIADYPDPWNINSYGFFACMALDWKTLASLQGRILAKPIKIAWGAWDPYFDECMQLAAKGGPVSK
jgi:hypothetical protein